MYKIFIDSSNSNNMMKLASEVEKVLLNYDNTIVYTDKENTTRDDKMIKIKGLELDAYILLQDETELPGPEVIVEEMSKVSNGLAKEVYKEVNITYYNKEVDKGVMYKTGVVDEALRDIPAIIVNVIAKSHENDVKWLNENMQMVADAIGRGIIKSFSLKWC